MFFKLYIVYDIVIHSVFTALCEIFIPHHNIAARSYTVRCVSLYPLISWAFTHQFHSDFAYILVPKMNDLELMMSNMTVIDRIKACSSVKKMAFGLQFFIGGNFWMKLHS